MPVRVSRRSVGLQCVAHELPDVLRVDGRARQVERLEQCSDGVRGDQVVDQHGEAARVVAPECAELRRAAREQDLGYIVYERAAWSPRGWRRGAAYSGTCIHYRQFISL